jgi:hypothetical protein
LARELLASVTTKIRKDKWDYAIAVEANLALLQPSKADGVLEKQSMLSQEEGEIERWLYEFSSRDDVFAFELGSLLRQLRDIWGLDEVKSNLLRILQDAAFERQGSRLDLSSENVKLWAKSADHLGHRTLPWLETAVARGKSVGMIVADLPLGSGFLVRGSDLVPRWGDRPIFLTSAHQIKPEALAGLKVVFHATDPRRSYELGERIYYSPQDVLDVAAFTFKTPPQGLPYTPVSKLRPDPEKSKILYIVGHQDTKTSPISVYSNVIVESGKFKVSYASATTSGVVGSPVFDENWEAVAIHGGKDSGYYVDGLRYNALEGLILEAIVDMAQLESGQR